MNVKPNKYWYMKSLLLILAVILSTVILAQEKNKIIVDEELNERVLIGPCDRDGLESEIFKEYYKNEYGDYKPDEAIVKKIKGLKKGVEIVIVMGSWCQDSEEQVPRFYKIIDQATIRDSKINLIAVNRAKTAGETDISALDIERVPTFIFYKKGREIGRIVETPTSTLEKDMLLILTMGS